MKLAKLGQNVKFTHKTKFIFQQLSLLRGFKIIHCICYSLFLFQMSVSIQLLLSLSIVITLPASPRFRQLFLVFEKCGIASHRLQRGLLTLNTLLTITKMLLTEQSYIFYLRFRSVELMLLEKQSYGTVKLLPKKFRNTYY